MAFCISLNGEDWYFKAFYGEDWVMRRSYHPDSSDVRWWWKASVPGSVPNDLWKRSLVENPYFECNTKELEWISQRTWVYKKRFYLPKELENSRVQLRFEGVDYESKFYLNGTFLGSHRGMYTPVVFDIEDLIHLDAENLIAVVIEPAPNEQSQVGRTSLVKTHKSRMTYWWDFCPRLVHQGIWDDVSLQISKDVRIEDIYIRTNLSPDHRSVDINVNIILDSLSKAEVIIDLTVYKDERPIIDETRRETVVSGTSSFDQHFILNDPDLWYPNGFGDQPLYELEVVLHSGGMIVHKKRLTFGIREITLLPNDDAPQGALPYTLSVNGRKIYMKGWNWVPMDLFYGVPQHDKLVRLLRLAKEAHVNVLRVWGGGLIEKEDFYDLCDQTGILIWQEFIQSSSGIDNEPSTAKSFINMMVDEAQQIIPRKRNHPALMLWCGGNELQDSEGKPLDNSHPTLAALKEVVNCLDPDRLWLPTSPTGSVFENSLRQIERDPSEMHDVHGPWEYQGLREQYQLYNQGASLLHSEFGVEGITNQRTLDKTIDPENQWPISLDTNPNWWHLGAWWVKRKVWDQVFGKLPDIKTYIRATQFTQFDGLRYALEADRRRKFHNSGTFPWQFNEPYPMAACTSAVDYYARPKPVYYAVRAAYEPIHVSAEHWGLLYEKDGDFEAVIWGNNSYLHALENAELVISLVDFKGNVIKAQKLGCTLPANNVVQLTTFKAQLKDVDPLFFLDLILSDIEGHTYSANRYVFTCDDNLHSMFQQENTSLSWTNRQNGNKWELEVSNSGDQTAMFVWVEDDQLLSTIPHSYFSDNYFCLFPGERRNLVVQWENVPVIDRRLKLKAWNAESLIIT